MDAQKSYFKDIYSVLANRISSVFDIDRSLLIRILLNYIAERLSYDLTMFKADPTYFNLPALYDKYLDEFGNFIGLERLSGLETYGIIRLSAEDNFKYAIESNNNIISKDTIVFSFNGTDYIPVSETIITDEVPYIDILVSNEVPSSNDISVGDEFEIYGDFYYEQLTANSISNFINGESTEGDDDYKDRIYKTIKSHHNNIYSISTFLDTLKFINDYVIDQDVNYPNLLTIKIYPVNLLYGDIIKNYVQQSLKETFPMINLNIIFPELVGVKITVIVSESDYNTKIDEIKKSIINYINNLDETIYIDRFKAEMINQNNINYFRINSLQVGLLNIDHTKSNPLIFKYLNTIGTNIISLQDYTTFGKFFINEDLIEIIC